MEEKLEIMQLDEERYYLLELVDNMDPSDSYREDAITQIDKLGSKIYNSIKQLVNELEFDFILEQLSRLGDCPCLLYDDNGRWAVVSDGYQNTVFGDEPQDVTTTFSINASEWKETPRKALIHYLTKEH